MDNKPILKDKSGQDVELIPVKGLKLRRGFSHLVDNLPLYAGTNGEWYIELKDVEEYMK